jgi:hypothetical protein
MVRQASASELENASMDFAVRSTSRYQRMDRPSAVIEVMFGSGSSNSTSQVRSSRSWYQGVDVIPRNDTAWVAWKIPGIELSSAVVRPPPACWARSMDRIFSPALARYACVMRPLCPAPSTIPSYSSR